MSVIRPAHLEPSDAAHFREEAFARRQNKSSRARCGTFEIKGFFFKRKIPAVSFLNKNVLVFFIIIHVTLTVHLIAVFYLSY